MCRLVIALALMAYLAMIQLRYVTPATPPALHAPPKK